ncbi:MAG TPA: B-box zinc finger protein [Pyrinomonadaceae bacterium]|nr:B-box zinc finger protein [Pyrinomonadaceae bacterium]
MKADTELWQLMTHDGVYQADLPTLKQWVAEGIVLPTDKVRKGALNWIEAGRAPSLRRVFAGEEVPEPSREHAAATAADTPHAHAALGDSHPHAASTGAHASNASGHAQDLGLSAGASPFAEGSAGGFIEAVSTKDFPGVLPDISPEPDADAPAPAFTCQNHPTDAASLICRTCRETFCRSCPNRMGTSSVLLCPSCGNFCDPLEDINERIALLERAASGFGFGDFKQALAYPLKHSGSLIGGALLYSFLLLGGLWGHLLAPALVFGCISLVIHRVGYGTMDRDFLPDFSEFSIWDDMLVPYFLGWGITLVSFGPVLLLTAVLVFGMFGGGAQAQAPQRPQGMTPQDMEVLQNGGTAEQEAELQRKVDAMTPSGQMAQQARAAKQKQQDDSALSLVRTLLARPGLFFLLALVALAWAAFYYPMALLVAGWTESFKSIINPLVGLDTMRHMGLNYFKAFAMYLAVYAAGGILNAVVAFATSPFDMPFVGNVPARFIGGFVTFYTSLVIACVLGLSLFKSADRLGIELD